MGSIAESYMQKNLPRPTGSLPLGELAPKIESMAVEWEKNGRKNAENFQN
jgi:hypothetical protein